VLSLRWVIELDEALTLSIANPLGTSDEIRIPARMALISPLEKRKLASKSSDVSQTQIWEPIDTLDVTDHSAKTDARISTNERSDRPSALNCSDNA
jgi:hypothetical protein